MVILPLNTPRIIIRDGLVFESRYHHASGVTIIRHDPAVHTFFLDYVDDGGVAIGVWEGSSYAAACAAVREWQLDGVIIDDRVSDAGGAA